MDNSLRGPQISRPHANLCRSRESVLPLCCYGKVLDFIIKKHKITKSNSHTVKMPRKCITLPTYEAERSPVRFHLHKGRTLSLRKWLKPIVVAICVSTHSTKNALPSSLQIEAFWVSTFYTRDFHLVLSPWTLSIFYVVARMWPLHIDIVQLIITQTQRKREIAATLVFVSCLYSNEHRSQKLLTSDFTAF